MTVALDLHAPHLARADAAELMLRAHERRPYSNATRGNVDVALTVDGTGLALPASEELSRTDAVVANIETR